MKKIPLWLRWICGIALVFVITILSIVVITIGSIMDFMGSEEKPRNFLVLFQNNSELRFQGGLVGASVVIESKGMSIKLKEFHSASDYPSYLVSHNEPIQPNKFEREVFDHKTNAYFPNITNEPLFSRTAELAKAYENELIPGQNIDGVILVDPDFLAEVLGIVGEIEVNLDEIENIKFNKTLYLNQDNLADWLQNGVYVMVRNAVMFHNKNVDKLENKINDQIYSQVADEVFGKLSQQISSNSVTTALKFRDLVINSKNIKCDFAQSKINQFTLKVLLGYNNSQEKTNFENKLNIMFSEHSPSKMDYYLRSNIETEKIDIKNNGHEISLTLENSLRKEDVELLPYYITGGTEEIEQWDEELPDIPRGTIYLQVSTFLPKGVRFTKPTIYNEMYTPIEGVYNGFGDQDLFTVSIWLSPGEKTMITYYTDLPNSFDFSEDIIVTKIPQTKENI